MNNASLIGKLYQKHYHKIMGFVIYIDETYG